MAFLLRPDLPPGGRPRPDGSGGDELREPMRTNALESGLTRMKRPPKTPYSIPALEATEYAKENGKFYEFHKACYVALWDDGKDLEQMDVLEGIAKECDLDWPELRERLESRYYQDVTMEQYLEGRRLGFNGIPGFIIGNGAFTGAAPYEMFKMAADRALSEGHTITP